MIEVVFTIDYEINGNGTGQLSDLVYAPTELLTGIFKRWNARFVTFVEVAEFEKIEAAGTDSAIDLVTRQIRELHRSGFELGLHIHPQWYNAQHDGARWLLDFSEYNLCMLPQPRIAAIVDRALNYMRHVVGEPDFVPLSFRAGNWLFQPTAAAAKSLAEGGIRIDSSVFKGGVQHNHRLDYRRTRKYGYYWRFESDCTQVEPQGRWLEIPIYTEQVPFWRMATAKRLAYGNTFGASRRSYKQKWNRGLDFLRFLYPLKLDFCRMTLPELTHMMDGIIAEDRRDPESYRPVVLIGHTKDLCDPQTVDNFLSFLRTKEVPVATFDQVYSKLRPEMASLGKRTEYGIA